MLGDSEAIATIAVKDLATARKFYEGTLGLPRAGLAVMWAEGQLPKPRRRPTVEGEN